MRTDGRTYESMDKHEIIGPPLKKRAGIMERDELSPVHKIFKTVSLALFKITAIFTSKL